MRRYVEGQSRWATERVRGWKVRSGVKVESSGGRRRDGEEQHHKKLVYECKLEWRRRRRRSKGFKI